MSALPPSLTATDARTRLAWLAMALTPGLGPIRILRAAKQLADAAAIFDMPLTGLEALQFPAESAQFIAQGQALAEAEKELAALNGQGARLLTFADSEYPEHLREIFDPPVALWVRGDAGLLARPAIAIVGTRHPTPYGAGMAEVLARDLAARRLVVLSGMARGIDTAAHKGALAARGATVAVWGTGVDVIYPKENKALAEAILASGGAIVSEYRLGTFPAAQNFPRRNRILSGMSTGVLVVEAGENSGTRVTARCAADQNRDVYAVPGNVTTKNAWGPNTLIKQGARLVATWEDVWEELPTQVRLQLEEELNSGAVSPDAPSLFEAQPLNGEEQTVLDALRPDQATQQDELMEKLEGKLTSPEIITALLELEMAGRVQQLPGKNYVRRL